jgi:inorganic pyrophosphatase
MKKSIIEIEIKQSGRTTGEYQADDHGFLRLMNFSYPEVPLPFDLAFLPDTLTDQNEPAQVFLLGETSHPLHTQVSARLLGGIQTNDTYIHLIAVALQDKQFTSTSSMLDLPEFWRKEIEEILKPSSIHNIRWLNIDELQPWIKQTRINYRLAKAKHNKGGTSQPAWKPVDSKKHITSYAETDHYTAAEYTFFQLPYHIQHYVSEYLDKDERILYAVHRPTMYSQRLRSWLGREKLREGVLILTTQRLIQLVELVPLGNSGVRYGFRAQLGVLERLVEVSAETLADEVILLRSKWKAQDGCSSLEWESPLFTQSDIYKLISFLENFSLSKIKPRAIQRSTLPVPDELPLLRDPASNSVKEDKTIHQHFSEALPSLLLPAEQIYAWALWPAWFENNGVAQVLVVTSSRLLVVSDTDQQPTIIQNISFAKIATVEYVGSILNSYIELSLSQSREIHRITLRFPYSADVAFHRCFEAMRRCLAVTPLVG